MRIALIAVGRLKAGAERDLVERYRARIAAMSKGLGFSGPEIVELDESRAASAAERRRREASEIAPRLVGSTLLVLDERGTAPTSPDFAARLGSWRDAGQARLAVVIGGPDGLDESIRSKAELVVAFGRLTVPHGLVRVLASEQIYRALTILAGHPYHRGEPNGR